MKNIALITAGGKGVRMGYNLPKQFILINRKPIIIYTLEAFERHPLIDVIAVVCIKGWEKELLRYAKKYKITKLKYIVPGGKNGQDSIRNGLFELAKHFKDDDMVSIHDGIRPLVSESIITDNIKVAKKYGNATAIIPCAEAMIETEDGIVSSGIYPRDQLKRTQTPQTFYLGEICKLHRQALKAGITNSVASCALKVEMGEKIYFSPGSEKNIKLTTSDDIDIFKALLAVEKKEKLKSTCKE